MFLEQQQEEKEHEKVEQNRSICSTFDSYDFNHEYMNRREYIISKITVDVEVEVSNSRTWFFMSVI